MYYIVAVSVKAFLAHSVQLEKIALKLSTNGFGQIKLKDAGVNGRCVNHLKRA